MSQLIKNTSNFGLLLNSFCAYKKFSFTKTVLLTWISSLINYQVRAAEKKIRNEEGCVVHVHVHAILVNNSDRYCLSLKDAK